MQSTPRLVLTGRLVMPESVLNDGALAISGDRIAFAGKASELPGEWHDIAPQDDQRHTTLLPGLVDAHCHGGAGGEFGAEPASARAAAAHHHKQGTTSLLGSLVSAHPAELVAGVRTCAGLVRTGDLAGVHLEGPFLSHARRGAQNPEALRDLDRSLFEELVRTAAEAAGPGALAQMTFAPERAEGNALARLIGESGILPALGHTDCDADAAWAALRAAQDAAPGGRRPLVTHVFNGMPPLHHRSPGPVAACLAQAARGEAVLEVIGDGVHLDAATVRMLFDVVGPDGICLITDAMAACGMPEGSYTLGGRGVLVSGRTARLADGGSIAGGVATLLDVVRWCVQEVGLSLLDAVRSASSTPAAALGLTEVGALLPGRRADVLVVEDDTLGLRAVLRRGEWLIPPP